LDYHPDNIMTDGTHTTIIDFMTACTGDPAADVAAARIVLTKGEMIQSLSPIMKLAMNLVKRAVCSRYVKQYQKKTGLTRAEMDAWNFAFYIVRLGVWNIESEKERFSQLLLEDLRK
ncbi:MAG TPA: phosphotransferase, partial [Clostridiales bacterium]|nr:phosphotransferase [Clostridiales bacterium]